MRHEADDDDGWQGSMTGWLAGWLLRPPSRPLGKGCAGKPASPIAIARHQPQMSCFKPSERRTARASRVCCVCMYVHTYIHALHASVASVANARHASLDDETNHVVVIMDPPRPIYCTGM